MPIVNSSFLRRSGVRNALRNAESNVFLLREAAAGSWRPSVAKATGGRHVWCLELGDRATGGGDLLLGRRTERVRRHLELHATQIARPEHLHQLALADRAGVGQ